MHAWISQADIAQKTINQSSYILTPPFPQFSMTFRPSPVGWENATWPRVGSSSQPCTNVFAAAERRSFAMPWRRCLDGTKRREIPKGVGWRWGLIRSCQWTCFKRVSKPTCNIVRFRLKQVYFGWLSRFLVVRRRCSWRMWSAAQRRNPW